jgi:hypothetical protein
MIMGTHRCIACFCKRILLQAAAATFVAHGLAEESVSCITIGYAIRQWMRKPG